MNNPLFDSNRAGRILDVVTAALERPPAERAAFLLEVCGGDEPLRAEVQSLLDHEASAQFLLTTPAFVATGGRLFGLDPGELRSGDTLGDCRIIRFLGEGGTGEVYLAQDTRLERQVAVKLLKRQFDEGLLLRRFQHERRVLAGLTHPNIARLYGGSATPEGRPYLVMEYIEGERLDRFCDAKGLDVTGRLEIFGKVCTAVAYAHQNLVVHRDLKPSNVRVTAEGEPKLLDFGIAKLLETGATTPESSPTLTMQAMMTPEYASPEQLRGEVITTASDVYSLGVVLYELLTGQRPYAVSSRRPDELARAICEQEPARPSTVVGRGARTGNGAGPRGEIQTGLRRRLEGDLDNIVAMALRKEPARRYASVLALAGDLRRHAEALPVTARQDTLAYRTSRFVRRNKMGVAAATLVVLALVGGLVATTWQTRVANQERDRARAAQARAEAAQKQAERINGFLQQLLGSASPRKMGKDVKVVQVLDAAGASVDRELATEPEVLAQVHHTLGETYQVLALHQQASRHFDAAANLMRRLYGDEDERSIFAEADQAVALCKKGLFIEPEPLLRHTLAFLNRQPKIDEAKRAIVLRYLTYCLIEMHRTSEVQGMLKEAVASAAKAWGVNSTGYADTLLQASSAARYGKNYGEGVEILRHINDIYERAAPDDPQIVTNEFSLCLALIEQHKFAESQTEWDQAMLDCERLLGSNDNRWHRELVFGSEVLDFARRDFAKVIAEGPAVLEQRTAGSPDSDGYVVTARYVLGAALTCTGRAAEGEPLLRQALADYDPAAPAFLLGYGNIETALGDCLRTQGRYAEAEPLLLAGYDKLKLDLNEQTAYHEAGLRLHNLYVAWNKPAQAAYFAVDSVPVAIP